MHSKENSSELLKYSCILEGHLDWEARENYLELREDFRKGKLKYLEFCVAFEKRGQLNSEARRILESNLILFSPHQKSFGFSDLLEEIFDLCSMQLEDAESYDYDKNSEIEFKNRIEETYFQIQNYLNEEGLNINF
jgi:hypothetical protein